MTDKMQQVNAVNTILAAAEQDILKATGVPMRLIAVSNVPGIDKSPEGMLKVIADTLDMDYSCYKSVNRKRPLVELRYIAATLIKEYFGSVMTLEKIGKLFNQHHSTIIAAVETTRSLVVVDTIFKAKYEMALDAVTQWMASE